MARVVTEPGADLKPPADGRRRDRPRSPLEAVGIPLTATEGFAHTAGCDRGLALGEPMRRLLRFATWYPTVLERWMASAVERGIRGPDDCWYEERDDSCRRAADALAHRRGSDGLVVHLVIEEVETEARLVARYCHTAPPPPPAPRWTDAQRLTFEELVSGIPCRGCGRGFRGGPEWKPVTQRTPEEQVALEAEEAMFKGLHRDCSATRWTISGGGVTHCSACCPPPPLGPEQSRHSQDCWSRRPKRRPPGIRTLSGAGGRQHLGPASSGTSPEVSPSRAAVDTIVLLPHHCP